MSSTDRPDLVFLGATVETMTDDAGPADAVAVRDGRIVVRRELGGCAAPDRAGNAGDRARRRDAPPWLPGCACPSRSTAACSPGAATSTTWPMRPRTSKRSRPTRPRTPTASGSTAAAGRCPPSRAASRTAACSTRSFQIGRPSSRATTATSRGPTRAPSPYRGSTARRPIQRTAGSCATPTVSRPARCTTVRSSSSTATRRRRPAPTSWMGSAPPRATCTRSGSPPGRTRS